MFNKICVLCAALTKQVDGQFGINIILLANFGACYQAFLGEGKQANWENTDSNLV